MKTTQEEANKQLIKVCEDDNFIKAKDLLTRTNDTQAQINSKYGNALSWACVRGNIELVKYLLTSPELKEHANIHANKGDAIVMACYHEHIEIVKYLLTSPELKEHANINANNDEAIIESCRFGNLEIIKYILTSPELKTHANMYNEKKKNEAILEVVYHNYPELFNYFVFEYELKIDDSVKAIIIEKERTEMLKMLEKKELETRLINDLQNNKESKKFKI